jgi:hypothetical protein
MFDHQIDSGSYASGKIDAKPLFSKEKDTAGKLVFSGRNLG